MEGSGEKMMKKIGIVFVVFMFLLCGCRNKSLSDEEIFELIRENNTSEKLKETYQSVYVKDKRNQEVYSVYDSQDRRIYSFFDDRDQVKSVRIEERDFAYCLNEDSSFSQLINMKEEADTWEKISSLIAKMEFQSMEKTDAFYILKARVAKEDLDGYLDDVSDISSIDLDLLVDKNSFTVTSFQNETLNYTNKEKAELPELEIIYNAKDVENESEKILIDHMKKISEYRTCTIITDRKDSETSTITYNVASGDHSGVLLPEDLHINTKKSQIDNETNDNDVTYYVTDSEDDMEEKEHEGEMSADGVYDDDASGFVSLSEYIPDAILEIRYYSTYNFIGERISGYEEPMALLSKEAAKALKQVSDELVKKGYRLKIYDAYRPQSAVDHFVRWSYDIKDSRMKKYFYPELDKAVLFKEGYIAEKSSHTRGSTVDLTIFDMEAGKELDMGSTFDLFAEISHSDYSEISDEQKANRALLRTTMEAHGFAPYAEEWWHFTLKDEPYPNTYFTFPVNSDSIR